MGERIEFTIPSEPATKKTSQRVVRAGRRMRIIPSERTISWTATARTFMQFAMRGRPPLTGLVAVTYRFYRRRDVADLGGLEAALDDALQGPIIENDRQIVQRVSERLVDRENPRVEVTVVTL